MCPLFIRVSQASRNDWVFRNDEVVTPSCVRSPMGTEGKSLTQVHTSLPQLSKPKLIFAELITAFSLQLKMLAPLSNCDCTRSLSGPSFIITEKQKREGEPVG
mmetsp:Transcript_118705/g.313874  ORF Transcript_118705/g.313874 Transcript_118705/m.313874 type:complete len:103 (-) Transcript_118705:1297-1605(-)